MPLALERRVCIRIGRVRRAPAYPDSRSEYQFFTWDEREFFEEAQVTLCYFARSCDSNRLRVFFRELHLKTMRPSALNSEQHFNHEDLRKKFEAAGQGHVFRFWNQLTPAQRTCFAAQLATIDLEAVNHAFRGAAAASLSDAADAGQCCEVAAPRIAPAPVIAHPEHQGDREAWAKARALGEASLRAGRVAILVVAGGQGTRLGFSGPKGLFPIGPVSARSLFELQAQRIRALRARYATPLPWYIMTSHATDTETRRFFEKNAFFGLPREDVFFLCQGSIASVDFKGKILLETPGRIFENPDGHGGSLIALARSGALADMRRRGVEVIFYYQVDNPLVQIANPALLGFHQEVAAEISCLVVAKRDAAEKMGVVAEIDGCTGIVEYTEIDDRNREAVDAQGKLVFWAGNIAVHALQREFVERIADDAEHLLPFHASKKRIPFVDADGNNVAPEDPNGFKFERFFFDALPAAQRVAVVEALRCDEFSPVKNASGADSPELARADLSARYRRWLRENAIDTDGVIEIDEAVLDGPEAIHKRNLRSIAEAGGAIRQRTGA